MRVKLRSFSVFFLLIFCCNKLIALGSTTIPESDILHKGDTPGVKKRETFDGFSDIFGIDDFKTSVVDKPMDFFALYGGREVFNCTFTWENLRNEVNFIYAKYFKKVKICCLEPAKGYEKFNSIDSYFYRYFRRFFKSPGRLFLDGLTFLIFFQRAFLGMDTLVEYSIFLKKKIFFTVRCGWDYNDFTFGRFEDMGKVGYNDETYGSYGFNGMDKQRAVEICGGNIDSFENEKKKADFKYCNELASVKEKNEKLSAKGEKVFENNDEVFVFTSLYKYFLDFGVSYYNNPRNPAESTFIFRFLIKFNAFYNVTGIDYVIASKPGVISHFTVDDVINKHVSSPIFGCKVCLCFGYKNWEVEISVALYNNYKEKEKCSGQFYSESLQNESLQKRRLPVSIALRNRFIGL